MATAMADLALTENQIKEMLLNWLFQQEAQTIARTICTITVFQWIVSGRAANWKENVMITILTLENNFCLYVCSPLCNTK